MLCLESSEAPAVALLAPGYFGSANVNAEDAEELFQVRFRVTYKACGVKVPMRRLLQGDLERATSDGASAGAHGPAWIVEFETDQTSQRSDHRESQRRLRHLFEVGTPS